MGLQKGYLIWDFDGTLAHRLGTWSDAMLQVLRRFADVEVEVETFYPFLQRGFPWHTPDRTNPPMRSAKDWWDALVPVFEEAFVACRLPQTQARQLAAKVRIVYTDIAVGIPVKLNAQSEGKPNGIPGRSRTPSERSDAGIPIVQEVFGFVKRNLSGAKRRTGAASGERGAGKGAEALVPAQHE